MGGPVVRRGTFFGGKMNLTQLGLAIVCGVMEFVKAMKDGVTVTQVADKAIRYIQEARDERLAAEQAENDVFDE
jgi:hypothetical protein